MAKEPLMQRTFRRTSRSGNVRRSLAIRLMALVAAAVATAMLALGAAAGATGSIAQVVGSPASYANQQVTLVGTVDPGALAFRGESLYALREAGRVITVLGLAPAPAAGAKLAVTGQVAVRPPDAEITFPPVLLEAQRTSLP